MAVINEDKYGLVVQAGSYTSRPVQQSKFKKGDKVKTHHFYCTIKAGIGKDKNCKTGEYLETWYISEKNDYETMIWCKVVFINRYWKLCPNATVSVREQKIHDNYFKKD